MSFHVDIEWWPPFPLITVAVTASYKIFKEGDRKINYVLIISKSNESDTNTDISIYVECEDMGEWLPN